eukprot:TRINITY_DN14970_c0_g1_i1.p1 TRINITY_DN14970_c0_g1~~TRINITY_DN14970_c0_g1_i1.p1  ORF type:complete len:1648 (+),score=568.63 TRINITY_DN14970_c0_g1_i1:128-4945(+)
MAAPGVRAWQPGAPARPLGPQLQERRARSRHLVVRDRAQRHYVLSSLCSRDDTQVFTIDPETGRVHYSATPGIDLFQTPEDALEALGRPETVSEGCAIAGYRVLESEGLLLLVGQAEETLRVPPAHRVLTVSSSHWVRIPLSYPFAPLSPPERRNVSVLTGFAPGNAFYYCETYDVTHIFPNSNPLGEYNSEWVWNHSLRQPFREGGVGDWCVVLLQGLAQGHRAADRDLMNECYVGLLTRRSSLNPAARQLAEQGLSEEYSQPGNECESELLVYTLRERSLGDPSAAAGAPAKWVKEVRWASHLVRRGAVPVAWRGEGGAPRLGEDPFRGCGDYWKRVMRRYGGGTPVVCLSLLRRARGHAEQRLGVAYEQSLVQAKKGLNLRGCEVRHFDMLAQQEQKGPEAMAEALWADLRELLPAHGVSSGVLEFSKAHGTLVGMERRQQQQGLLRLNCTDALDRTNLAAFLISLQAAAELARSVGVQYAHTARPANPQSPAAPGSGAPWPLLRMKLADARAALTPPMLGAVAGLYVANGDACAGLDVPTGGPPAPQGGLLSAIAAAAAAVPPLRAAAGLARAALGDGGAQQTAERELLLGHALHKYFPSLLAGAPSPGPPDAGPSVVRDHRLRLLSRPAACAVLRRVPCLFRTHPRAEEVLIWPTPRAGDPAEPWPVPAGIGHCVVSLLLPEAARVVEVSITLRHGGARLLAPRALDIYVGPHADACVVAAAGLQLPLAPDGAALSFTLPRHLSGIRLGSAEAKGAFHEFFGHPPPSQLRVVHLVFYSRHPSRPMLLGPVRVLGAVADPTAEARSDLITPTFVPPAPPPPVIPPAAAAALAAEQGGAWRGSSLLLEGLADALGELTVVPDKPPLSPSTKNAARELHVALDMLRKVQEVDCVEPDSDDDDSDGLSDQLDPPSGADCGRRFPGGSGAATPVRTLGSPAAAGELPPRTASAALRLYEDELGRLLPQGGAGALSFAGALHLEERRLHLRVPSLLRDVLLWRLGLSPAELDPARRTCRREPGLELQLRKRLATHHCSNKQCQRALRYFARRGQCAYCRLTFCRDCMAQERRSVVEFGWEQPCHELCRRCLDEVNRQRTLIKRVADRSRQELAAPEVAPWEQVTRKVFYADLGRAPVRVRSGASYDDLISAPYSVAESRHAAVLSTVPTHRDSPPIEAILYQHGARRADLACGAPCGEASTPPLGPVHAGSFWFAPDGVHAVEIDIVLPFVTHVTSVVMLCDPLGYEESDRVRLAVSAGLRVDSLFPCGEWVVGDGGPVSPLQRIDFSLGNYPPDDGARVLRVGLCFAGGAPAPAAPPMRRRLHLGCVLVQGLPTPLWRPVLPLPPEAPPLPSSLLQQGGAGGDSAKPRPASAQLPAPVPPPAGRTRSASAAADPSAAVPPEGLGDALWAEPGAAARLRETVAASAREERELALQPLREDRPGEWDAPGRTLDIMLGNKGGGCDVAAVQVDPCRPGGPQVPPGAQARDVRLLLFRQHEGQESMVSAGDYELPLVQAGTLLTYWLPLGEVGSVRRIRLEVLTTYGGPTPARPGLVALACPGLRRLRHLVGGEEPDSADAPQRRFALDFTARTVQWYDEVQAKELALR